MSENTNENNRGSEYEGIENVGAEAAAAAGMTPRMWNGVLIRQRADGYLDATAMCRSEGKLFAHWHSTDKAKSLLDKYSQIIGKPTVSLVEAKTGRNGGTWVHPRIAVHVGYWCSHELAIQIEEWTSQMFTKGYATRDGRDLDDIVQERVEGKFREHLQEHSRFAEEYGRWLEKIRLVAADLRATRAEIQLLEQAGREYEARTAKPEGGGTPAPGNELFSGGLGGELVSAHRGIIRLQIQGAAVLSLEAERLWGGDQLAARYAGPVREKYEQELGDLRRKLDQAAAEVSRQDQLLARQDQLMTRQERICGQLSTRLKALTDGRALTRQEDPDHIDVNLLAQMMGVGEVPGRHWSTYGRIYGRYFRLKHPGRKPEVMGGDLDERQFRYRWRDLDVAAAALFDYHSVPERRNWPSLRTERNGPVYAFWDKDASTVRLPSGVRLPEVPARFLDVIVPGSAA